MREQAGYYDSDIAEDDEETKELLQQAEKIKAKEDLMRLDSRQRKSVEKAKMPRRIGRKRERSMSRLESELGALGVDITKKKMRNLELEQDREQLGKKIRVGRSPSLAASRPPPRQEIGVVDKKVLCCLECLGSLVCLGSCEGEEGRFQVAEAHAERGEEGRGRSSRVRQAPKAFVRWKAWNREDRSSLIFLASSLLLFVTLLLLLKLPS